MKLAASNSSPANAPALPRTAAASAATKNSFRYWQNAKQANDSNPKKNEYLEWAGWDADYDPEHLDIEECRRIVERYNS